MTADNVIPLVPSDTLDRALIAELRHAAESLTRRGIDATWIDLDELRALLRAADERDTLVSERDALRARLDRITAPTAEIMPIAAEPDDEPVRPYPCPRCGHVLHALNEVLGDLTPCNVILSDGPGGTLYCGCGRVGPIA